MVVIPLQVNELRAISHHFIPRPYLVPVQIISTAPPLKQVFANIAIIVMDEESPAVKDWFTWRDGR